MIKKIMTLEIEQGTIRKDEDKSQHGPMNDVPNLAMAMHQAQYVRAAKNGKAVLDECASNVDCYMKKLTDPKSNQAETAMMGEKSAYMIGLLGGEDVKMKLVDLLPRVRNPAVTAIIMYILINKSPSGDDTVAKKLQEYIDKAEETRDQEKIDEVKSYKQIVYRLQARKG
jgi:hypothetical protein